MIELLIVAAIVVGIVAVLEHTTAVGARYRDWRSSNRARFRGWIGAAMFGASPEAPSERQAIETKSYRSAKAADRDASKRIAAGSRIVSRETVKSRRGIGLLFGLIGYWILPQRTRVEVTYQAPVVTE